MKQTYPFIILAALACSCSNVSDYDACGNFEAEEIMVSAQGAGQVLYFDASEGARIEAGAIVGVIDTMQLHYQKAQLEAQIKSAESSRPDIVSQLAGYRSQLATLRSERLRSEKLIAKGAAPQKQLDDINSQITLTESNMAALEKSLKNSSLSVDYNTVALQSQIDLLSDRIDKCNIKSPAGGTVLAKYINAGELVNAGTPLMKVADLEQMYLRAYFTSDQLADVNLGDRVTVTADFGADRQFEYPGTVTWISNESEFTPKAVQTRNTRANLVYAVKIAVANDGRLKIGMYGEVRLK